MSTNSIDNIIKEKILSAQDQIVKARDLLDKLKLTGEASADAERNLIQAEQRLERYKKAFGVE